MSSPWSLRAQVRARLCASLAPAAVQRAHGRCPRAGEQPTARQRGSRACQQARAACTDAPRVLAALLLEPVGLSALQSTVHSRQVWKLQTGPGGRACALKATANAASDRSSPCLQRVWRRGARAVAGRGRQPGGRDADQHRVQTGLTAVRCLPSTLACHSWRLWLMCTEGRCPS